MKKKLTFCLIATLLVMLVNIGVSGREPSEDIIYVGRPFLREFSDLNGLPSNSVMTLERDLNGFLWAGSQDGAAYFNGHRWITVTLPNRSISNYVYDILATKDGAIWIGTDGGGLHRFHNGEWKTFDAKAGLISNAIRCLYETFDESGRSIIWIGTRSGLSRFDGTNFDNFDASNGLPDSRIRDLVQLPDGTMWIGTYGGIAVWRGAEKTFFTVKDGLPDNTVFALLNTKNDDDQDVVYAGTDAGLAKFENGAWTTFEKAKLSVKGVRSLTKTVNFKGEELVWAGFDGAGLAYLENGIWHFLDEKDGLKNNLIFALEDAGSPDGSVWLSMLSNGIARLEKSNWVTFDERNGLTNKAVFAIYEDGPNSLWMGTYGGGAVRYRSGVWDDFGIANGLPNEFVHCFLRTTSPEGNDVLYIGTEKGLAKFENGKLSKVDLSAENIEEIWALHESTEPDGSKSLWIIAGGGVVQLSKKGRKLYTTKDGLPDDRVRAVLETRSDDGKRVLWFATLGGLARFEDEKFTAYTTENGLPNDRIYSLAEVRDDSAHQIWIGTGGGGLAIMNLGGENVAFQQISSETSHHLLNDTILQIFLDPQGRVYLSTNKGVARFSIIGRLAELNFRSYIFTTEDGLPSNECIAGASLVDSLGRIWVGTIAGAAVLDLTREFSDEEPDRIFVERILANGKERKFIGHQDLPYNENDLTFEYTLLSNFRENASLYRTQLVGLEDEPTEWTKEPNRKFSFLPDGNFTLKIWGMDASGNISDPFEIPFRIRPAWWRTWWAYAIYFVAFAGFISMLAYLVYRNRLMRFVELEKVRHRIASDLHDDIGASLSQISLTSEILANSTERHNVEEKKALMRISEASREATGSMSDIVWAINPKRDNVQDLVQRMRHFASDILSVKDIALTFSAPLAKDKRKIGTDLRRQIYLVFKEAINNCAKHAECTEVKISFREEDRSYVLEVKDNGKGFDTENFGPESTYGGNGLASMLSRAEAVGGRLEINSKSGGGTAVVLKVPRTA